MTCETYRQLEMLPYLYGLLEPLETAQMAAHMENCAECQEAMKGVREQVGMLAEAIRQEDAAIVFKAPTSAAPPASAPTVLMPPAQMPRRALLLNRWTLAASILLCLFVIGAGLGFASRRAQLRELQDAEARLAQAQLDLQASKKTLNQRKEQTQEEIRAIQKELDQIFDQWKKEEGSQRTRLEKDRVQVTVDGPKTPVAGAPNTYNFEVRSDPTYLNNLGQNAKQKGNVQNLPGVMPPVQARVIDQHKKVLYQQDIAMQGNYNRGQMVLPPNMPIKPGEQLAIEFQMKDAEGKLVNLTTDPFALGFPEYVTHLATDRPLYHPGDTVRFRSLTLERFSLKPAETDFHLRFRVVGAARRADFQQRFPLGRRSRQGPGADSRAGRQAGAWHRRR